MIRPEKRLRIRGPTRCGSTTLQKTDFLVDSDDVDRLVLAFDCPGLDRVLVDVFVSVGDDVAGPAGVLGTLAVAHAQVVIVVGLALLVRAEEKMNARYLLREGLCI